MPEQAGWYPDPANPDAARWWDGTAWTQHVRAGSPPPPAAVTTTTQRTVPGWEPPAVHHRRLPGPDNWLTNNVVSLMAMLASLAYVAVLLHGAVIIFGLFPLGLAVFGYKLHERLAVAALVVAALTFVANIVASINFF